MDRVLTIMKLGAFFSIGLCLANSATAELTNIDALAEHLGGYHYDHLHKALQSDAAHLIAGDTSGSIAFDDEEMRLRLLLLSTLERLPIQEISSAKWITKHGEFLDWLFLDPAALSMLAAELRAEDKVKAVLEVWARLWKHEENPEFRTKYARLALSLALIYDDSRNVPTASDEAYHPTLKLIERYEFFRDASESGKLQTSAHQMSVRDLIHVVDLNVSQDEIDWARRHARCSRKSAGQNYSAIEYLMERAVENENPYKAYILSEIKKHGGICGDQSHYSMNAAKAQGIPAVTIIGTGDRGAHAWLGYMPEENTWATFGSQGITNGKTLCRQIGRRISFRHLHLESHEDYQPEIRLPVLVRLTLAEQAIKEGSYTTAKGIITDAKKIGKMNREIWELEKRLLIASNAAPAEWKAFFTATERAFKEYAHVLEWTVDLKIRHLFAKLPEDERIKLLEQQIRRVARKLGTEESALISVIDKVGAQLADQESAEGVKSFYAMCFRKYGEDLELFNKIMGSYARQGGKLEALHNVIGAEVYRAYKRSVETSSKEYFRADMELQTLARVISLYEQYSSAADREKIARIKKGMERRRKKIAKAAL